MIVLVDDIRSFRDTEKMAETVVFRNSATARDFLRYCAAQDKEIDELFLDHDLGFNEKDDLTDDIWPVIEILESTAFWGKPLKVRTVFVHSSNPSGADRMEQVLRRWNYNVVRVATVREHLEIFGDVC